MNDNTAMKNALEKVQNMHASGAIYRSFLAPLVLSVLMLRQLGSIVLLGVKLEGHDITLVLRNLFVIAHVNLLSTLRNETHVGRNDNQHSTSLEGLETSTLPVQLGLV